MPVNRAIALVPDAASISGALLMGVGRILMVLVTDQAGLDANSITVTLTNNLCRIFIIITLFSLLFSNKKAELSSAT